MRRPFPELDGHDAYDLLGVSSDSPLRVIQQAHKRQQRIWHPDNHQNDPHALALAQQRSRLLNAARDILTLRRADYDAYRARPREPEVGPETEEVADPWSEAEEVPDPWDEATPSSASDPGESVPTGTSTRPPSYPPVRRQPPRPPPPPVNPRIPPPSRRGAIVPWALGGVTLLVALVLVTKDFPGLFDASDNRPSPSSSDLAGTWSGRLTGRYRVFDIRLSLSRRAQGFAGKVTWPTGECSLAQKKTSGHTVILTSKTSASAATKCEHPGEWNVTVTDDHTLRSTFKGAETVQGTLTPSRD